MDKKTRSVSIEADRVYIEGLNLLAKKRGTTVGKLIRQASDAAFENDLKPLVSFFAQSGNEINHSEECHTKRGAS